MGFNFLFFSFSLRLCFIVLFQTVLFVGITPELMRCVYIHKNGYLHALKQSAEAAGSVFRCPALTSSRRESFLFSNVAIYDMRKQKESTPKPVACSDLNLL